MPEIYLFIQDIGKFYIFNPLRGLRCIDNHDGNYIILSSDAFSYAMNYDWGWESIHVAARFQLSNESYYSIIMHSFCLGVHRNFQTSELEMGKRIIKNLIKNLKFKIQKIIFLAGLPKTV